MCEIPKRPSYKDVIDIPLLELATELESEHFGTRSGIFDDLKSCVSQDMNGYKLAKDLERSCGWSIDCALVERLDSIDCYYLLEEATKRWVIENNIQLPKKIGNVVSFWEQGVKITGEVTWLHQETAEYTVFCESEGHVREGSGTHGYIIMMEDIL